MEKKKILAGILSIGVLATVVTGCGEKKGTNTASGDGKEPITFTAFYADANPNADNFQSPVAKKITEMTGVTLDIEYNISGDEQEKLSLMAASGEYPDLIYGKSQIGIIKNAGGLIPLDDLIEEHAPNIKKLYGEYMKRLRFSSEDPSIYVLPTYDGIQNETLKPANGVFIQHAVMKELGYPEVKTVEDLENVLKTYYEKYPTINEQDTIPFMLNGDDWRTMISVTNPACFMTGGPDDGEWYVNPDTYEVQRHLTRPEEREYFKWLNHMNDVGLLYQESFIQKSDSYESKIASGRVLAVADAAWSVASAQTALRQAGMEERMFGYYPITLNENYKHKEFIDTGYLAGYGLSISTACKDPVRLIKFIDQMVAEEAQILLNWGIEGEHYEIDEKGKRVFLPEVAEMKKSDPQFTKKTGVGLYINTFPHYGNQAVDSTGNLFQTESVEQLIADQTDIEKEVLAAYGAETWKDLYPTKEEFPVKQYGVMFTLTGDGISDPEIKAKDNRILEIGYKRIVEAILAPPAQFDSIFDAYLKEVEGAGLSEVTATYNKAIQDRLELWK